MFDTGQLSTALENLSRLASKPGVQSTLVLSRSDGAVIRSTGLAAAATNPHLQASDLQDAGSGSDEMPSGPVESIEQKIGYGIDREEEKKSAEAVAKTVLALVSAAGGFVSELDKADEVQLLRIRTRKCEMVIVPGEILRRNCCWSDHRAFD